jgi:hypothetical protein
MKFLVAASNFSSPPHSGQKLDNLSIIRKTL